MNRFHFFILICCYPVISIAQEATQNYIRTRTMLDERAEKYLDDIQYYDGLGRPFLNIQKGITPAKESLVTLQEYDAAGRESKSWLPHVVAKTTEYMTPGTFKSQIGGSYDGDTALFDRPVYETSPLNRLIKQYGPGKAWNTKPVSTDYLTNTLAIELQCKLYSVSTTGALVTAGNYGNSELYVTKITDEDQHVSYTFKDKQGQHILTRQVSEGENHDTYHVYDDFGNQIFVLSPMYQENANLDLYAYQYKYDGRNRCIEKKLPGCQPVKYVYDKADRLIFSQDGQQRTKSEWSFYLYDSFNRLTVQGVCTNTNTSTAINLLVTCSFTPTDTGLGNSGYTSSFSLASPIVHLVNYYDNYRFLVLKNYGDRVQYPNVTSSTHTTGFLTGNVTTLLDNSTKIYAATYYDNRGRSVKTTTSNHLGGYEVVTTTYTFTGKPLTIEHVHSAKIKSVLITQKEVSTYAYDHAERLLKITHKLNAGDLITLVENEYDDFGRLLTKKQHGSIATTYAYNIRNWLTGITNSQFTQNLYYNTGNGLGCYNGNISSMTWKSGAASESLRGYKFSYDGLSRLVSSTYGEGAAISPATRQFSENISSYDKNGGIKSLQRYGKTSSTAYGIVDNLTFAYNGNQLKYVNDAASDPLFNGAFNFVDGSKSTGSEYLYDATGNLTQDFNKKIAKIQYNVLNLPHTLQFSNGNTTNYVYGADGIKRRVTHQTAIANVTVPMGGTLPLAGNQIAQAITTDYCGNVVYENEKLSKILTPEGYVTMSGTTPTYHYYVKDHQGNNRMVANEVGTVEQVNHYYPFGGLFAEGVDTSKQAYKYNGKELDRMHGLDWYDYDARMMDPNLGFMPTLDPLCEKSYSISPYAYCANNPVNAVDPDGKLPVFLIPLVKGAIGAVVDAAAQVTVSMANGRGFGEALSDVDYTSVGTSFLTSALAMPGMSTAAKVFTAGAVVADAAVDINSSEGFQTVLNSSKSIPSAVIDVASSILPGKAVDGVTSAFNKAVTSDLTSASAATMTKATKSGLKQAQSVVNSTSVQTGANAGGDFVSGLISGQYNESMKDAGEGVKNNTIPSFPELRFNKTNQYIK